MASTIADLIKEGKVQRWGMCVLATIGAEKQLVSHATGSMRAGNSKATLYAAMIQCLPYIGFPNALNAIQIIKGAEERDCL